MQMHDARHIQALLSCPADHTAGKLYPRIPGGLGVKIIRITMEDDRPADDLFHMESSCKHHHVCFSRSFQQRRQVSRMVRVLRPAGGKVTAAIGETVSGAVAAPMNMQGEEPGFCPGKAGHLRLHQNAVAPLIETNRPT